MPLVFIPTTDYSTSTADAETITSLDLGYVKGATSRTVSFRIGSSAEPASSVIAAVRDAPYAHDFAIEPDTFTLEPDAISDTIAITLTLPLDVADEAFSVLLNATTDSGEVFTLPLTYETVGPNAERLPQYPRRAGQATDISTGPILALGDSLVLHRYDPLPYDGGSVIVEAVPCGRDLSGEARNSRFRAACDPCVRLNALDPSYGYAHSQETILAQFQRETRTTTTHLLADNTVLTYNVAASLILPAAYDLNREWALFSSASGADRAQYKRTVWLVQRQSEYFSVENIRTLDFGEVISHFECDLIALHERTQGSPDYWNPFALTYEYESDKPYAAYACPLQLVEDPYLP